MNTENGTVVELARTMYEANLPNGNQIPETDLSDAADLIHYNGEVSKETMENVLADVCQVVWLACDSEAEGTSDVMLASLIASLAVSLDNAGIKWTSGR